MRRFHSSIFLPSRQIVVRVIRTYSIAVTSVSYDDSVAVLLFYLHSMEEFLMLTHTRDIVLVKGTGTSIKDYLYISSAPPIVFVLSVLSDAVKQRESGWNMFA